MTKKNDITLPTPEDERLLNDVLEDSVDYVEDVYKRQTGTGLLSRSALVQIILHYPLYFHFSCFSVDIASQLVAVPYIHA